MHSYSKKTKNKTPDRMIQFELKTTEQCFTRMKRIDYSKEFSKYSSRISGNSSQEGMLLSWKSFWLGAKNSFANTVVPFSLSFKFKNFDSAPNRMLVQNVGLGLCNFFSSRFLKTYTFLSIRYRYVFRNLIPTNWQFRPRAIGKIYIFKKSQRP